jgi:6-bladed beta-propeller
MRAFGRLAPSIVLILLVAGCGRSAAGGGLAVSVDSTADTVFVRVAGAVPASQDRRLVEDLRIAPAADDTSLFTQVYRFAVDRGARFWAYDLPTRSIFLFGPDGRLIRRIGREGGGPGEFRGNNGMAVLPDGRVAVLDAANARISFLDSTGAFLESWRVPAGFSTSDGLRTDRSGSLELVRPVTDPREGEIIGRLGLVRLREGGAFGDSLVPPDLPVPREPYVANVVQDGKVVGSTSTGSDYAPKYYWTWHPGGYFVVANGGTGEIILARPNRKPLAIVRSAPAVPIPDAARSEERAGITHQLRQNVPDWSWSGPDIPGTLAPILRLAVGRDGRIWAQVAAPLERIPDRELVIPRDSTAPVRHYRIPTIFEIYEPDGRFVARVTAPPSVRLMELDGDRVWALARDENDLPALMRFTLVP